MAPHTSNWDFLVGLGARAVLNFDPKYVGKKELFRWPFGGLFKALGGYPVERTKQTNFVQAVANIFEKEDDFILTITPEGTRSRVDNWKTGFYYIAEKANVPILPVAFDYSTKTVVLGELKTTDQDVDTMISDLKQWYRQFRGKHPHKGVV